MTYSNSSSVIPNDDAFIDTIRYFTVVPPVVLGKVIELVELDLTEGKSIVWTLQTAPVALK